VRPESGGGWQGETDLSGIVSVLQGEEHHVIAGHLHKVFDLC